VAKEGSAASVRRRGPTVSLISPQTARGARQILRVTFHVVSHLRHTSGRAAACVRYFRVTLTSSVRYFSVTLTSSVTLCARAFCTMPCKYITLYSASRAYTAHNALRIVTNPLPRNAWRKKITSVPRSVPRSSLRLSLLAMSICFVNESLRNGWKFECCKEVPRRFGTAELLHKHREQRHSDQVRGKYYVYTNASKKTVEISDSKDTIWWEHTGKRVNAYFTVSMLAN